MSDLTRAQHIIELEKYYKHNPGEYTDYFEATYNDEVKLTANGRQVYLAFKKTYGLARQSFIANNNTATAVPFIAADNALQSFKIANSFKFNSIDDFYQQTAITALKESMNRLRIAVR